MEVSYLIEVVQTALPYLPAAVRLGWWLGTNSPL